MVKDGRSWPCGPGQNQNQSRAEAGRAGRGLSAPLLHWAGLGWAEYSGDICPPGQLQTAGSGLDPAAWGAGVACRPRLGFPPEERQKARLCRQAPNLVSAAGVCGQARPTVS